ncbi:zinc ribbon domain-containing protein [Planctomicrobium sp. SH527]|uniref:zinc ribbon domain-containing protein n=1 Tax=Planctomicrobium sp. SH527 TaxID=3448123 RepID=UPI003F5C7772
MASAGAQFGHLHSLHVRLKDILDQLGKGPRQIKVRQTRIAEAEQQLVLREQELKDARAAVDRKNLDLKSKESHLLDLQGKLNTASSNREFDIIKGQMEADRVAKAVLEDEILEWLDRVDARSADVTATKKQIVDLTEDLKVYSAEFDVKAVELRDRENHLRAKIKEVETIIPNELKVQYDRLVEAYGAEAMASSENGMCNQCFVSLTPQHRVLVNSGKLMICSVCGRLLYPVSKED